MRNCPGWMDRIWNYLLIRIWKYVVYKQGLTHAQGKVLQGVPHKTTLVSLLLVQRVVFCGTPSTLVKCSVVKSTKVKSSVRKSTIVKRNMVFSTQVKSSVVKSTIVKSSVVKSIMCEAPVAVAPIA